MHMDSEWSGSASARSFPGLTGNGRSPLDPLAQSFSVFQDFRRDAVVLHYLAVGTVRPKRFHAAALEVGTSAVVYLEIERIIVDEREEQIATVDAKPTEHAPAPDIAHHPAELLQHEAAETGADRHKINTRPNPSPIRTSAQLTPNRKPGLAVLGLASAGRVPQNRRY